MKALILAAGLGNRLGELTKELPKAMVRVADRELILHVLNFLNHPQITGIGVVTGYRAEGLASFLKNHDKNIEIFHNPDFRQGSIRSLEAAIPFLDDDFLLLNVDHIYPKRMLPVITSQSKGITAICDFDRRLGSDDMKVKLNSDGFLIRIMKTLADYDCGYIGMTRCDFAHVEQYVSAIRATREIYGDDAPAEWVLGHLAANGKKISICDASGLGWYEVDTQEDLMNTEKKLGELRIED